MKNEAHIVNAVNGHLLSNDCWCEPSDMKWVTNVYGAKVFIVFHEDIIDPRIHHSLVLEARDDAPEDWITRFIESAFQKEHPDEQND